MDITPELAETTLTIDGYGPDGVVIRGETYEEPIALFPGHVRRLPEMTRTALSHAESYRLFIEAEEVEIVLVGTGAKMEFIPHSLRRRLKDEQGVTIDMMDTGAACRTYNVLISEGRSVAALLMPPR